MWKTLKEGLAQARREKSARERRDIEQEEIARAAGVTTAAYSRWEKGDRIPKEDAVTKLAEYFGVTAAYLRYGITDAPKPNRTPHARLIAAPDVGEGGRAFVERVSEMEKKSTANRAAKENAKPQRAQSSNKSR